MNPLHHRKAKLASLLADLERGKRISDRAIKTALTGEEWLELQRQIDALNTERQERKLLSVADLSEFRRYVQLLKKADLLDSRAEATRHNRLAKPLHPLFRPLHLGSLTTRQLLSREADIAYEQALEELEQLLSVKPGLAVLLDRPVQFGVNWNVSSDVSGVPRLFNSRSEHSQNRSFSPQTKRELQRVALQASLTTLTNVLANSRNSTAPTQAMQKSPPSSRLDDGW